MSDGKNSEPPITGHGAQAVMKVQSSDGKTEIQKARELQLPGLH